MSTCWFANPLSVASAWSSIFFPWALRELGELIHAELQLRHFFLQHPQIGVDLHLFTALRAGERRNGESARATAATMRVGVVMMNLAKSILTSA